MATMWHIVVVSACITVGCAGFQDYEVGEGQLQGRVLVEWRKEDGFIYRASDNPVKFRASFMKVDIVPEDMYTDGGSVPRVFWSVPGLSPWGLGPAYIIHDWIFEVHRCNRDAPPEVREITFEQSALILAEVGRALVEAELIEHNLLPQIVWAVRTKYARNLWDRDPLPHECDRPNIAPVDTLSEIGEMPSIVVDFIIPDSEAKRQ